MDNKAPLWRLLLAAAATAGIACSSGTEPRAPTLLEGLPRQLSANEVRVAGAANQFALSLFRTISAAQTGENVFLSPLSVSFSLGMAMNGANGTTLDQMQSTLDLGGATLGEINDGYRSLMSLEQGLDATTTFDIANSMWYRDGFPVLTSFSDTLENAFQADVRSGGFGQPTIDSVNAWVSDKTRGKITSILDEISGTD